ncbi:MAG: hypothetical protein C0404_08460 [Verrucomicrobia bacterium]|nr:hypothetical protein [Verrucomicrobiota bacterium]
MAQLQNLKGFKVLLVDDDDDCRDFFEFTLIEEGAEVTSGRTAEEGVEFLKKNTYDIVITDKNLPGMDGVTFIKKIRQDFGNVPIIMITGHGSIGTAVDALKLGAQDYLLKPLEDRVMLTSAVGNILERQKLSLENRRLQTKLIQAERMESIGILAAGIAHEINNPTTFIIGNLELIREFVESLSSTCLKLAEMVPAADAAKAGIMDKAKIEKLREDTKMMADDALDGAQRIKRITGSLKGFSHPSGADNDVLDLNEEVNKSLTLVWNELKYKCEVEKMMMDLPKVKGNGTEIDQVLVNMLINSGQSIEHKNGKIVIKTYPSDGYACIEISDNGKGISQEHLAHIFDPFFTTKEVGQGTGLGLSIAYNIIQNHKGIIEVRSKEAEGTTMLIKLPAGG